MSSGAARNEKNRNAEYIKMNYKRESVRWNEAGRGFVYHVEDGFIVIVGGARRRRVAGAGHTVVAFALGASLRGGGQTTLVQVDVQSGAE